MLRDIFINSISSENNRLGENLKNLTKLALENHCTRTVQSSRGGCSRRVHKIEYLAVNKGNILVISFTSENIHRELLSLVNPAVYLLNKIFVA